MALALTALLICGALARYLPANEVVFRDDGSIRLFDTDSYYHLRHAQSIADHYPSIQRWDVGTHFPRGQRSNTAGLFDFAIATVAWILGLGAPSFALLERIAAWMPLALGVSVLAVAFVVLRRRLGPLTALGAVALVDLYPSSDFLARSQLGFADHHAAEAVLLLLSAWGLCAGLEETADGAAAGKHRWDPWQRALLRSLPMLVLVHTWAGAPIYFAILFGCAWLTLCVLLLMKQGIAPAGRALGRHALLLGACVALLSALWPTLVLVPRIQGWLMGGLSATFVAFWAAAWATSALERRQVPRWGQAGFLGLFAAGTALLLLAVPAVRQLLDLATHKVASIQEHHHVTVGFLWDRLGPTPWLAALGLGLLWQVPPAARARACLLTILALATLGLWRISGDYGYVVGPLCAIGAAVALGRLLSAIRTRFRYPAVASGLVLALTTLGPFASGMSGRPWRTKQQTQSLVVLDDALVKALTWMREHTPEPPLPVDARVPAWTDDFRFPPGSYGVVSTWEVGNFVAALGRRTAVTSQGVHPDVIRGLLLKDEDESLRHWQRDCEPGERVRYVLLDARTLAERFVAQARLVGVRPGTSYPTRARDQPEFGAPYTQSMAARLFLDGGQGLQHYRLVYDSFLDSALYYRRDLGTGNYGRNHSLLDGDQPLPITVLLRDRHPVRSEGNLLYAPVVLPAARLFEIVPGATIRGQAPPGSSITARLPLRSGARAARFEYTQSVRAGPDGSFSLTIPYPTEPTRFSDVVPLGPYRIDLAGGPASALHVTEDQIQSATELRLPTR